MGERLSQSLHIPWAINDKVKNNRTDYINTMDPVSLFHSTKYSTKKNQKFSFNPHDLSQWD